MASFGFKLICCCSINEIKNFVKLCSIPPKLKRNFLEKEPKMFLDRKEIFYQRKNYIKGEETLE